MLLHRAETFLHIVSTTDLVERKNSEKDDVAAVMDYLWASALDDAEDDAQTRQSTLSGDSSGRKRTIGKHNVHNFLFGISNHALYWQIQFSQAVLPYLLFKTSINPDRFISTRTFF